MSLKKTALSVVRAKRMNLEMELTEKEHAIRRHWAGKGSGGAVFVDAIADYEDRLKQLADVCLERRRWVIEHSVMPGWFRAAKWQEWMDFEMGLLYLTCFNRLDLLRRKSRITSDALVSETTGRLDRASAKVRADLELGMATALEESRSQTKRHGMSLLKRAVIFGAGAATTYAATAIHTYLESH